MPTLQCRNIGKQFGALIALDRVSFELHDREILGLIGPNGAGKTTLFNCIIGLEKPTAGKVIFGGTDITGLKPHKICRIGLAKTSQIMEPFKALTVLENVLVGALHGGMLSMKEALMETEMILGFVGLDKEREKLSSSISVPARRRLELARAMATGAKTLLLDENMAGLNPHEIDEALVLLTKIRHSGRSLIVVEHVMRAVMGISDRIIVLNYGTKIAEGSPAEIAQNSLVIEAYLGDKKSLHGRN
ncbi:MAG: transporter ATP-binding protein [Thermodesulfobacteriota bacterium]|nr:transporter ATP-binding protein [Thermodesulfobacteriota bacterium]